MNQLKYQFTKNNLPFLLSDTAPELLIVSGTHGNEYEVIDSVKEIIAKYEKKLPPFLFIPEVSPSAVAAKTRLNKDNADLNNVFGTPEVSQEAVDIIELLRPFHFKTFISFHEDPTQDSFYLYDSGDMTNSRELKAIREKIKSLPISLFSGVDDPDDPGLGYEINDGYVSFDITKDYGRFGYWLTMNKIAKRVLEIEVPGKINPDKKTEIVDILFQELLLSE